jgi:hypothetical protein
MRAVLRPLALLFLFASVAGCGARSGLELLPPEPGLDAGSRRDAPLRDTFTPFDVPPECRADGECDDGASCSDDRCDDGRCVHERHDERCDDRVFCDGPEICAPGPGAPGSGCLAGAPVACADAQACTLDFCDEFLDACVFDPRADRCPVSHRCDPVLGCVARAIAHDGAGFLYEVDRPTGALRTLGTIPSMLGLTDIALHPDGTLYGASGSGVLYAVDYEAGTSMDITTVGGSFNALDVAPDGTLYGASSSRVVRFDLASGAITDVASLPAGMISSGDLAFVRGNLFATTTTSPGSRVLPDALVRIDVTTRSATIIGGIGHPCVWGLAPFGETLYGLTCTGLLLQINVTTGAGTVLATHPPEFYGAGAR